MQMVQQHLPVFIFWFCVVGAVMGYLSWIASAKGNIGLALSVVLLIVAVTLLGLAATRLGVL